MWGIRLAALGVGDARGITPTCVGNTGMREIPMGQIPGSPPRVWGILLHPP